MNGSVSDVAFTPDSKHLLSTGSQCNIMQHVAMKLHIHVHVQYVTSTLHHKITEINDKYNLVIHKMCDVAPHVHVAVLILKQLSFVKYVCQSIPEHTHGLDMLHMHTK